jgi:hypothetical protein
MIRVYPQYEHPGGFILTGTFDQPVGAADALVVRVGMVRMADCHDIGGLLAEGVSGVRRKRIGNDDGLIAADTATG